MNGYIVPSICGRTYLYGSNADASVSSRIVAALTVQINPAVMQESLGRAFERFPHFSVGLCMDGDKVLFRPVHGPVPVFHASDVHPECFGDPALGGYLIKVSYIHKTVFFDFHRALSDEPGMLSFVKSVLFDYLEHEGFPLITDGSVKLSGSECFKAEGEDAMVRLDDLPASRPVWYMDAKATVPSAADESVEEVVHLRIPAAKLRKEHSDIVNIPVTYIAPLFSHAVYEIAGGNMEAGEYVVASVQVNLRPYYPSPSMLPYHTSVYLAYNRNLSDYPYATVFMSQKKLLEAQLKPDTLAYSAQQKIAAAQWASEAPAGETDSRFSAIQEKARSKFTYDIAGVGHVNLPECMQRLVTELYPVMPSPGAGFSVAIGLFRNEVGVTISGRRHAAKVAGRLVELLQANDIDAYLADRYTFVPMRNSK